MKILAILIYLTFVNVVSAFSSPMQVSPGDGEAVSSSKLTWQAPSYELFSGNAYRVQVDESSSFADPKKDYYTANLNYTPSLTDGRWFWRVRAKDSSRTWSDWSTIWSFTLSSTSPSLPPSSFPSSAPPSESPSPSSSSTFTISNIPAQIDSTQNFSVSITLSLPSAPNSTFYLKGAFKKEGSSNYFGLTKVGSSWIKNGDKYSKHFPITTDSSGHWSGNLEFQPDSSDTGYQGSGDYIFKVARYTSSGSGPTWTSETSIKINANETEIEEEGVANLSKLSPQKSPSVLGKKSEKKLESLPEVVYSLENYQKSSTSSAQQTSSPSSAVKSVQKKKFNLFYLFGGIFLFASGGLAAYLILQTRVKSPS